MTGGSTMPHKHDGGALSARVQDCMHAVMSGLSEYLPLLQPAAHHPPEGRKSGFFAVHQQLIP